MSVKTLFEGARGRCVWVVTCEQTLWALLHTFTHSSFGSDLRIYRFGLKQKLFERYFNPKFCTRKDCNLTRMKVCLQCKTNFMGLEVETEKATRQIYQQHQGMKISLYDGTAV